MCPAFDDGIRLGAVRDGLDDRNDRHKSLVTPTVISLLRRPAVYKKYGLLQHAL